MINGIISVITVFILLGVGFVFTHRKMWPEQTNRVFFGSGNDHPSSTQGFFGVVATVDLAISSTSPMTGKFIIHPLLIWAAFSLVGMTGLHVVEGLPLSVFVLMASLPCHAQTAIVAEFYDVEGEYASNLVSLSTLISLVTIPIYAGILL